MRARPKQFSDVYSSQFKDSGVVEAYRFRPPYPAEVFTVLSNLMVRAPKLVLDVGCGTGDVARYLAPLVERVDGMDFSPKMIEAGKRLPGGEHHNLNWIEGRVEEIALQAPYSLVTAGESLHWMEWETVLPLFRSLLIPGGQLAILEREMTSTPWNEALHQIIPQCTTNKDYVPYHLATLLEQRGLFQKGGEVHTRPVLFVQSVEDYIESFHSRNGFSRERMGLEMANAFDEAVREAATRFAQDGCLSLHIGCEVVWGIPGKQ